MTESQLHQVIKESVKKVLCEIELGTLKNAAAKAYKDKTDIEIAQGMDKLFGGNRTTDNDTKRLERRKRQGDAFRQEFDNRMRNSGKQTFYDVYPSGEIKELYLTPQEADNYGKYLFDDYLDACRYMQS